MKGWRFSFWNMLVSIWKTHGPHLIDANSGRDSANLSLLRSELQEIDFFIKDFCCRNSRITRAIFFLIMATFFLYSLRCDGNSVGEFPPIKSHFTNAAWNPCRTWSLLDSPRWFWDVPDLNKLARVECTVAFWSASALHRSIIHDIYKYDCVVKRHLGAFMLWSTVGIQISRNRKVNFMRSDWCFIDAATYKYKTNRICKYVWYSEC